MSFLASSLWISCNNAVWSLPIILYGNELCANYCRPDILANSLVVLGFELAGGVGTTFQA
jgi:hypothetical protein